MCTWFFSTFSIPEEGTDPKAGLMRAYGAFVVIGSFARLCLFVVRIFVKCVFACFLCLYSSRSNLSVNNNRKQMDSKLPKKCICKMK